jgi:anaerobic magnesium-protoporphyrin IX monomethyl ester cyclase
MINLVLAYPPNRNYKGYGQARRWFPLGIAYLASFISKNFKLEIEISILDLFDYSIDESIYEVDKLYRNDSINVLGVSVLTEQRFGAWELLQQVNDKYIKVIGGVHATIMAEQISVLYNFVDYIIKGEGENGLLYLLNGLMNPKIFNQYMKIIEVDPIEKLDTIPFPREAIEFFETPLRYSEEIPIIFSRGCTDNCSFCSTTKFWKGYRSRSAENVFEEIKDWNKAGYKKFKFQDDASTACIEDWKELCYKIINYKDSFNDFAYDFKIEFEITARIDQFDEELIMLLSKAGCKQIAVGIESANEKVRMLANKQLQLDKAVDNIFAIQETDIYLVLMFVAGLEGDNDETINETCEFIRTVKPNAVTCQPLMIFPGTLVYNKLKNAGVIDDGYWLKDQPQPYVNPEQTFKWQEKILGSIKEV